MALELTDKQKKTGVALAAIGLVGGLFIMHYPKKALEIGTGCLGLGIGAYWFINIRKPTEVKQAVAVALNQETNTAVLRDFATRLDAAGYKDDAKAILVRANALEQAKQPVASSTSINAFRPLSQSVPTATPVMAQRIYR